MKLLVSFIPDIWIIHGCLYAVAVAAAATAAEAMAMWVENIKKKQSGDFDLMCWWNLVWYVLTASYTFNEWLNGKERNFLSLSFSLSHSFLHSST